MLEKGMKLELISELFTNEQIDIHVYSTKQIYNLQ